MPRDVLIDCAANKRRAALVPDLEDLHDACLARELLQQGEIDFQATRAAEAEKRGAELEARLEASPRWWWLLLSTGGALLLGFVGGGLAL